MLNHKTLKCSNNYAENGVKRQRHYSTSEMNTNKAVVASIEKGLTSLTKLFEKEAQERVEEAATREARKRKKEEEKLKEKEDKKKKEDE